MHLAEGALGVLGSSFGQPFNFIVSLLLLTKPDQSVRQNKRGLVLLAQHAPAEFVSLRGYCLGF